MVNKTFEILDISEIQSFSVKVTEQIEDKHLLEFLRTSIFHHQININKHSRFYYKFISFSLSYEIIVFNSIDSKNIPEPFIYKSLCDVSTIELFITQHYFCLFDSTELILYKTIENILKEDIQTYIEQLYKIKIDKVTIIDTKEYNNIKDNFITHCGKYKFDFYPMKKDNSFIYFLLSFFLIITIFLFSLFDIQNKNYTNTKQIKNTLSYEKGYKELLKLYNKGEKKPIKKVVEIFNYLSSYNISIKKLSYKNSKLYLKLENNSRKKLLQNISDNSNEIEIQSIYYDKIIKKYIMDIIINVKK